MPVRKRTMTRRSWNSGHLHQLRAGNDYFGDAWGKLHDATPDTLAEMESCWADHGDEIKAAVRLRSPRPTLGELLFERGVSLPEALERMRY